MTRRRYTEEQIIAVLKDVQTEEGRGGSISHAPAAKFVLNYKFSA